MRGGPFSETCVIDLLNARFVPFFFNTGGPGEGHDDAAKDFVLGKVPNRWAYFAAFAPDGRILGQTGIYDTTPQVFAWLRALLLRYPEFDRPTAAEAVSLFVAGTEMPAAAALDAARRCEQIAKFAESQRAWRRLLAVGDGAQRAEAFRGLLRVARADGDWPGHAELLIAAVASAEAAALATDLAIERGLRLLAERRHAHARVVLESAIAEAAASPRLAELHYEAGRACWFLGDRDWAKAHWCWILEHRADDRMAMRARLAAGAEVFPYPNGELGNFKPKAGPVGPSALDGGVRDSQRIYQRLRERLLAHDFDLAAARQAASAEAEVALARAAAPTVAPLDAPESLVARLSAADAGDSKKLVDAIVAWGPASAQPLVVAAGNENFGGRMAAVVAIGRVAAAHPELDREPKQWFRQVLAKIGQGDGDLAAAASTSLAAVEGKASGEEVAPTKPRDARDRRSGRPTQSEDPAIGEADTANAPLPKGAFALVASLRDGNEHRVANNRVVAALEALGGAAVAPLHAATADELFAGRGYAAFALGKVLGKLGTKPEAAVAALQQAAAASDPYVAALAKSGLKCLQ